MLESFVVAEVERQRGWSKVPVSLHHFRSGSREVDIVLERPDGAVVGIEVKAASSVGAGDFAGLRALADRARTTFHRGVVLYTGARTVAFGKDLHALPLSALWRS